MTQYFNRQEGLDKRRVLRKLQTRAEDMLWERLRNRQVGGQKFRRQFGVGIYVLDFYCPACHVAIELDGRSHESEDAQEYDAVRTNYLNGFGISVLRFPNQDVYDHIEQVIHAIRYATCQSNPLLSEGEGGEPQRVG